MMRAVSAGGWRGQEERRAGGPATSMQPPVSISHTTRVCESAPQCVEISFTSSPTVPSDHAFANMAFPLHLHSCPAQHQCGSKREIRKILGQYTK